MGKCGIPRAHAGRAFGVRAGAPHSPTAGRSIDDHDSAHDRGASATTDRHSINLAGRAPDAA
jgi:hypothetical protein